MHDFVSPNIATPMLSLGSMRKASRHTIDQSRIESRDLNMPETGLYSEVPNPNLLPLKQKLN
jgi:hypothetical protein